AGASRGTHEAVDLRDHDAAFGGLGVSQAVRAVNDVIAPALRGRRADEQDAIDQCLIALDGTPQMARLGGNATIAVSMAVAHAAAHAAGVPLWRYLLGSRAPRLPMPTVQVFGGGAHASRRLDVQDVMLVPVGAQSFDQAIAMVAQVYRSAGELMAERG